MTRAFLVKDSDDMPVPDAPAEDFSAVDLLADYVGGNRHADRDAEFSAREEAGA